MTLRRILLVLPAALMLLFPVSAPARAPFKAQLTTSSHTPKVNQPWHITVSARTNSGKPLSGSVSYEVLLKGRVVGQRAGGRLKRGRFTDVEKWPGAAKGMSFVFRAVVKTSLGTVRVSSRVTVKR